VPPTRAQGAAQPSCIQGLHRRCRTAVVLHFMARWISPVREEALVPALHIESQQINSGPRRCRCRGCLEPKVQGGILRWASGFPSCGLAQRPWRRIPGYRYRL